MGRIVISTNVTLDGIGEDPTGDEGTPRGGWFLGLGAEDRRAWDAALHAEVEGVAAYLLGGRSYAWFAERWVAREGEVADLLRRLPKYVVRSSGGRTDWGPTTVLEGDLAAGVARVRAGVDGDVAVHGSFELVQALLELGVVDEVRLVVFPRIAGGGGRLFRELSGSVDLELSGVERTGGQLVRLSYDVRRAI